MKLWYFLLSLLGVFALAGGTALLPHHTGTVSAYPDPSLTPGVVATTDIHELTNTYSCGTYSECHRNTSTSLKKQVEKEYPDCPSAHEIDHLVPLALGGADTLKNLWCQPGTGQWNYHLKDRLESLLVLRVKGGTMDVATAQACFLQDWVACYKKYIGTTPSYGAVDNLLDDTDDEVSN